MNIVSIGGGPAGLYFGLLMKLQGSARRVTVVERNRPYDTFGWGVVFSDATLDNLRQADPVSARAIAREFSRWEEIDIHFKGRVLRSGGHGFIGIGRKRLLNILQSRCEELGVELVFDTVVESDTQIARRYGADLVIASDGVNSAIRTRYTQTYDPDVDLRKCRFVWLGTRRVFDAFTFIFVPTAHGWFQAHAYRFEEGLSTFIVETTEATWIGAGLDKMTQEDGIAYCEQIFAPWLEGHRLISNAGHLRGSAIWIRFPRVICGSWVHWNMLTTEDGRHQEVPVVLMGDAAHTAHFSIGSGTKLALEDAVELAASLKASGADLRQALEHYQRVRSVEVLKIQNAARNSTEWFENVQRYAQLEPEQFAYSLLTRSQRISHENLRIRDRPWLEGYERWLAQRVDANEPGADRGPTLPMLTAFTARSVTLKNRVMVAPTLLYSCQDGIPGPFHLVHLGSRALGGAGLVMAEMTAISAQARVTPGCPGLWNEEQATRFAQITAFAHQHSEARIGVQLGHAGRRGSTQLGWEKPGEPLESDNWPLLSASALPYVPGLSQTPRAMSAHDMRQVVTDFAAATRLAVRAGFDWIELQAAQGYLLSSFLSRLTNLRCDEYGGPLENRMRFPLEVFAAVRAAWPAELPISVRLSAVDWAPGGTTVEEAVTIARAFKAAGADMIVCSAGEVVPHQVPVLGRMFQVPFADRIRNEVGVATVAVGSISSADEINGIIASGRADLCAVSRPHLCDPSWTLREVASLGYRDIRWPLPYLPGKTALERKLSRARTGARPHRR
jgi:anthraniloyl-CoA monooxygenase